MTASEEAFARLPESVQAPLMGLVDVLIGQDADEKVRTRKALKMLSMVLDHLPLAPHLEAADRDAAAQLVRGLDLFTFACQMAGFDLSDPNEIPRQG